LNLDLKNLNLFISGVYTNQWRAEGGANGATAPGIQDRGHRNNEIASICIVFLNPAHIHLTFQSDRFSSNV